MIQILPGLPTSGKQAKGFSHDGTGLHSEGLVVDFDGRWTGNFIRGMTSYDALHDQFAPEAACIISGGRCYMIDVASEKLVCTFGDGIGYSTYNDETNSTILVDMTGVEAYRGALRLWQSDQIFFEEFRSISTRSSVLSGEAYDPVEGRWMPFEIDLTTGEHRGGSYS